MGLLVSQVVQPLHQAIVYTLEVNHILVGVVAVADLDKVEKSVIQLERVDWVYQSQNFRLMFAEVVQDSGAAVAR